MVANLLLPLALLLVQEEAAPPLSTKRHDVRDLLALRTGGALGLDLFPRRLSERGVEEDDDSERRGALLDIENLRDRVFASVIDDSKHEVTIFPDGDALRVTADDEVHAAVDQLLREIGTAICGEASIELRVVRGSRNDLEAPTLLDRADADHRESAATIRMGRMHVRDDGGGARYFDVDEATYLKDYEVEIAHGAELYAPIVATLRTGLTAVARASRVEKGVVVDLAVGVSEPAGPMRERRLNPKLWLTSPLSIRSDQAQLQDANPSGGTIVTGPLPLKIELPATRCLGVAGTFFVPDGKALWIPCSVSTSSGRVDFVFDVRAEGVAHPTVRRLPRAPDAKVERILLHLHGTTLAGSGIETAPFDEHSFEPVWPPNDTTGWPSSVTLVDRDDRDLEDHLRRLVAAQPDAYLTVDRLGGEWWLALSHVPLDDATFHAIETAFAPPAPDDVLELEGRILRGQEALASFRLPLLPGALATILSGASSSFLARWDVDVAGDTAIGNPGIGALLDGFALAFVAQPIGASRLELRVRGVLNFLDGPPSEKSLDNPYTPSIDDVKARRLFLHETRHATVNDKRFAFRFGGSPLTLECRVVRR